MAFRMVWPTQYGFITQQFRERPEVYSKFGLPGHEGIDFQAPNGSEIYAVAEGTVSEVRLDGNSDPARKPYGNQVRVQHADGYETIYAHLQQVTVTVGQAVKAGQLIGLADNTGNSAGAHLHFSLKKKGATAAKETDYPYDLIDPTPYLLPFGARPDQPEPPAQPSLQVEVISPEVGYLNLRAAPYVGAALLKQVPGGTLLGALEPADITRRKLGQQEQWLWVRTADGTVGYAAAWYLRLPGGAAPTLPPTILVATSPDMPLKVRSGPGVQYGQLTQVADGTVLKALESLTVVRQKIGQYNQWLNVQTPDGITGYSAAWYLKLQEAATSFALTGAALAEERAIVRPDDLRRIWGIGDKSAALLKGIGLVTFEQLARLSLEQLQAILAEVGLRGRHVATWPEQARLLSAGLTQELLTLQEKLGKRHAE